MVCHRMCDNHHYHSEEEERLTTMVTTTGDMAQGEGCHYDTMTRTTAMVTTTQDRLQERSGHKRPTTSPNYVIRLTRGLLRMGSKISDCFSHFLSAVWLAFFSPKNAKKQPKSTLWGALRARCPRTLKKHSVAHFPAWAAGHSCKWRLGSQPTLRLDFGETLWDPPCPNELEYCNIWDAVNMALTQPDDIRQPQISRFLFCFSWKYRTCGNDANCLGVVAGFPGISIFYQNHLSDLTICCSAPVGITIAHIKSSGRGSKILGLKCVPSHFVA